MAKKKHAKKGAKRHSKTPAKHHGTEHGHTYIIKRKGHKERFDERKVFASVYAACMSGHMDRKKCEEVFGRLT